MLSVLLLLTIEDDDDKKMLEELDILLLVWGSCGSRMVLIAGVPEEEYNDHKHLRNHHY